MTFVDTSALYALLDGTDRNHATARNQWIGLLDAEETLVTTNYVVVETVALVQNRLGMDAVRTLLDDILDLMEIRFVDADLYRAAEAALLAAGQRRLSLVDCASFQIMRDLGIAAAFAFDRHYKDRGFRLVDDSRL
ncbi:MAG: PIN domain-containing protein [Deltaproteobacteria bacterium]|nr:PIN domain-containing protein [Deltaproteobacteria bacterium]